jgi:hypothetical protein
LFSDGVQIFNFADFKASFFFDRICCGKLSLLCIDPEALVSGHDSLLWVQEPEELGYQVAQKLS